MADLSDARSPGARVAIAGCGPAGAVLGFLLARAGVPTVVFEKHGDFLRDFRGDTIHPSTLEILDELGLAERFLRLPHSKVSSITARSTSGQTVTLSLTRLPTKFPFIAFVPQWDFLEFLTHEASRLPTFLLKRESEVVDLLQSGDTVTGLRYVDAAGSHDMTVMLTIGADGRSAKTREAAGLPLVVSSPPMDVLWFRLPRRPDEVRAVAARLGVGRVLVMLDRNEYWQIAFVIAKGAAERVRAAGLDAFRQEIAATAPDLADRVSQIASWDEVKLLTVKADRLRRWYKRGYLAIGDAAHAMSPIGGVGINVAIHDAVAAANVLWKPLRDGAVTEADLARVQQLRERPVRIIQALQSAIQTRFIKQVLESKRAATIPFAVRALTRIPILRDIPPRMIALGINRPHVETPEAVPLGRDA